MFYTKEQVQRLEKYRKSFETAVKSGFARNMGTAALNEIEEVFNEAYGSKYEYNRGCSICVLGFLKKVGETFLKEAEIYRRKEEEEKQKAEEEKNFPPDVEMKDGTITFSFDRAEAEMEALNTNTTEPPKTNKRTRKKKEDGTD